MRVRGFGEEERGVIAVIFDAGIIIGLYFAEKIERKRRMRR